MNSKFMTLQFSMFAQRNCKTVHTIIISYLRNNCNMFIQNFTLNLLNKNGMENHAI